MDKGPKHYLGDGVYVTFDGVGIELTTNDGYKDLSTIYLEPEVWEHLVAFVKLAPSMRMAGGA